MSAFSIKLNTTNKVKDIQPQAASASSLTLRHTRWLFFALCCYLLSQAYIIPIFPIGPSWAVWPNFSDLATGLLVLALILSYKHATAPSKANWNLTCLLILILLGCTLSFTYYLTWVGNENSLGSRFGAFQLYRLAEFICVFWVTTKVPLPNRRIITLSRIVDGVLIFVCIGTLSTYFFPELLNLLTSQLPPSPDVAGPWSGYKVMAKLGGAGWGTIGYNHAYVASQILMLVSLSIHLKAQRKVFSNNILLFISLFACFLSESRAGMASMVIFAIIYWFQKPIYALVAATVAALLGITVPMLSSKTMNFTSAEGSIIERQKTLLDASNPENLSGRTEIWVNRIAFLDEEPIRWFLGSGFGAAVDSGPDAHMLALHVIVETGLIGLTAITFLFYKVLCYLYQYEMGFKSIFWVTVAFLFSSLTQETFYPVSAMGHFLGLYLCSLAIALRSDLSVKKQKQFALS